MFCFYFIHTAQIMKYRKKGSWRTFFFMDGHDTIRPIGEQHLWSSPQHRQTPPHETQVRLNYNVYFLNSTRIWSLDQFWLRVLWQYCIHTVIYFEIFFLLKTIISIIFSKNRKENRWEFSSFHICKSFLTLHAKKEYQLVVQDVWNSPQKCFLPT